MFTAIEGSTDLVHRIGDDGFRQMVEEHQRLIQGAVADSGGTRMATERDSVLAVFPAAVSGIDTTVRARRELAAAEATRALVGIVR